MAISPPFDGIPLWDDDPSSLSVAIGSTFSTLKVVLKVKDEVHYLRKWIDHYRDMVGLSGIVILDNMSTLPEVSDIYSEYGKELTVIRFKGFHNRVHRVDQFPDLYGALRRSCRYYTFLDCDEFLIHIDGSYRVASGPDAVSKIIDTATGVLPGAWLENVAGYDDRFWWDLAQNHPSSNLRSGKPIISAEVAVEGMINHNRQLGLENFDTSVSTQLFILHLKRLSNDQRIAANINKLHAYNAFGTTLNLDDILLLDFEKFPAGNKQNWIKEIQVLSAKEIVVGDVEAPLSQGTVRIVNDRIIFSSIEQQKRFDQYIRYPLEEVNSAISSDH